MKKTSLKFISDNSRKLLFALMLTGFSIGFVACDDYLFDDEEDDDEYVIKYGTNQQDAEEIDMQAIPAEEQKDNNEE
ncbi:MAG TPA: hypothetical protein PLM49_06870 [Bacteroidales bacterium]|nr:hypothetical protein [Bacteroidales bacterium]